MPWPPAAVEQTCVKRLTVAGRTALQRRSHWARRRAGAPARGVALLDGARPLSYDRRAPCTQSRFVTICPELVGCAVGSRTLRAALRRLRRCRMLEVLPSRVDRRFGLRFHEAEP